MSTKFPEYKGLDLSKVSEEIQAYWQENDIFIKALPRERVERLMSFLRGHHRQTDYQGYITF
jgi:isoleucyl-tRNA synthetase